MYHVELRQFPHNFCRFNLTEGELRETILDGWARGEWIEVGERKWSPHQATLTVLDGPELALDQLSLGRGWRNAQREGRDVTGEVLAAVRAAHDPLADTKQGSEPAATGGPGSGQEVRLAADSLALEVLSGLSTEPVPIARAWRLAAERYPGGAASDCLRLAELAVRSLAEAGLIVLLEPSEGEGPQPFDRGMGIERALVGIDGWGGGGEQFAILMRRA